MKQNETPQTMHRRDFLRGAAGGALALGTGQLLSGSPALAQNGTNGEIRMFLSTFLAGSVMDITIPASGPVRAKTFAQFGLDSQGRPETTAGLVVAPNNNLFVFSPGSDQVFMLDATTGARKRTLSGPLVTTSHNGAIGPDGRLYVVNAPSLNAIPGTSRPDTIERFDPATGDHIDTWVDSNTNPAIRGPFGLTWGPDGDLYVTSVLAYGFNPNDFPFRSDHVSRLDGQTGEFKGFVVRHTHLSFTMTFHPGGRLLLPSHFFNRVYVYDTTRSRLIDAFVDVPFPVGIAYGPDGDLYVASFSDQQHINRLTDTSTANDLDALGAGRVLRFDGRSGGPAKRTIISGLPFSGYIAFP